jgi:anthranilate phosphoribosyltransferase
MTEKESSADIDKKWTEIMGKLCDERYPPAAKLTLLQSVKDEDITGVMLAVCVRELMRRAVPLDIKGIDVCGTGGDRSKNNIKTFNISTAVAFVAAAGGISVIKHGNRAVSSVSGSSDVLAALRVPVCTNAAQAKAQHKKHNLCFVSAAAFHPALAGLAPVRKALGRPSFLNLLGPLCNPARTARQVMGVYGFQQEVAEASKRLSRADMMIVRSEDGLDEISLSDLTQILRVKDGKIEQSIICPEDVGFTTVPIEKLQGGSAEQNATIIEAVFSGTEGPAADIVCLNAAATFMISGLSETLAQGIEQARKILSSGAALKKLKEMKA